MTGSVFRRLSIAVPSVPIRIQCHIALHLADASFALRFSYRYSVYTPPLVVSLAYTYTSYLCCACTPSIAVHLLINRPVFLRGNCTVVVPIRPAYLRSSCLAVFCRLQCMSLFHVNKGSRVAARSFSQ